jgi:hypothetical protein
MENNKFYSLDNTTLTCPAATAVVSLSAAPPVIAKLRPVVNLKPPEPKFKLIH